MCVSGNVEINMVESGFLERTGVKIYKYLLLLSEREKTAMGSI